MNKIILLLVAILAGLATSCNVNNSDNGGEDIPTIRIHELVDHPREKLLAHELFSSMIIIRPETSLESMIGDYYFVKAYKNHLLINSEEKSLQVYDFKGRFLFKTKQGKGPNELVEVTDYTFDPGSDEIIILDSPRKRVLRMDLEGKVQDAFRLKHRATNLAYAGKDKCCYYVPFNFYDHTGQHGDYFFISDKKGNISDRLLIEREINSSPWVTMVNFISNKGSVYFQPSHYDTVFTVSNQKLKPALVLDYGKYRMPFKYKASLKLNRKHASKYLHLGPIFHTPEHLIMGYRYEGPYNFAIYDKKQKTFQVAEYDRKRRKTGITFGTGEHQLYLIPESVYNGNHLIMSCSSLDIINYLENDNHQDDPFYEPLIGSLEKVKEYDNPVFFIGTLK